MSSFNFNLSRDQREFLEEMRQTLIDEGYPPRSSAIKTLMNGFNALIGEVGAGTDHPPSGFINNYRGREAAKKFLRPFITGLNQALESNPTWIAGEEIDENPEYTSGLVAMIAEKRFRKNNDNVELVTQLIYDIERQAPAMGINLSGQSPSTQ